MLSAEWAQAGTLICQVVEEARRDPVKARQHLMEQSLKLVGGDFVCMVFQQGEQLKLGASYGMSPDEVKRWRDWYDYREDPMAQAFLRRQLGLWACSRPMLVDDSTWSRSSHVNEGWRAFGLNEGAVSSVALGPQVEGFFSITRRWGTPPFGLDQIKLLQLLHHATAWLDRRDWREAQLAPRLQSVYRQLLGEASEKEIATRLGLSVRTVHKYTEQIYRQLAVRSRAELMAM
ncbi:helix-turn-helix transcriptional regulator [bacterium]|nr:helix-turn-helix transcriptional regulator [bacterium]